MSQNELSGHLISLTQWGFFLLSVDLREGERKRERGDKERMCEREREVVREVERKKERKYKCV